MRKPCQQAGGYGALGSIHRVPRPSGSSAGFRKSGVQSTKTGEYLLLTVYVVSGLSVSPHACGSMPARPLLLSREDAGLLRIAYLQFRLQSRLMSMSDYSCCIGCRRENKNALGYWSKACMLCWQSPATL